MIDVLVVDDQQLIRSAFVILLRSAPGLRVVGEAGDGDEAVRLARELQPDVVLMDIRMPRTDGLQATRLIAEDPRCRDVRVLILTTFDQDDLVHAALRAGASGFLLKDTPPDQLLTAIEVVAQGEALLAPSITRRLIEHFVRLGEPVDRSRGTRKPHRARDRGTARGRRGSSNAEIADLLHMGYGTVKTHVSHLLTNRCPGSSPARGIRVRVRAGRARPQVELNDPGLYPESIEVRTSARRLNMVTRGTVETQARSPASRRGVTMFRSRPIREATIFVGLSFLIAC